MRNSFSHGQAPLELDDVSRHCGPTDHEDFLHRPSRPRAELRTCRRANLAFRHRITLKDSEGRRAISILGDQRGHCGERLHYNTWTSYNTGASSVTEEREKLEGFPLSRRVDEGPLTTCESSWLLPADDSFRLSS